MSLRAFVAKQSPVNEDASQLRREKRDPRNDLLLVFDIRTPSFDLFKIKKGRVNDFRGLDE